MEITHYTLHITHYTLQQAEKNSFTLNKCDIFLLNVIINSARPGQWLALRDEPPCHRSHYYGDTLIAHWALVKTWP